MLIARGMQKTVAGEVLTPNEREALGPYVDLIVKILINLEKKLKKFSLPFGIRISVVAKKVWKFLINF